jgi:hypothetical protein
VSIGVPAPTTGDPASVEVGVSDEFRRDDVLGYVRPE